MGFVESESATKIFSLHKNWRVMIAGDAVEAAYAIIDKAKRALRGANPDADTVGKTVMRCFQEQRLEEAEARFLTPRGLTLKLLVREGKRLLTESDLIRLETQVANFELEIELLIAGFDRTGTGFLLSVEGNTGRGMVRRHDTGFYAIGSGSINALFILNYREASPQIPLREALYYATEAKFYGEFATGVGMRTDVHILRPRTKDIKLDEETIEEPLMKICEQLSPADMKKHHIQKLNALSLKGAPKLPLKPRIVVQHTVKVSTAKARSAD
ncbi:MAG: hypothetical protein ACLQDV_08285 [Candidatus Binataceae bacterium]